MYGVVLNAGRGEVYATFGSVAECKSFIARGKTRGLGRVAIVRNPYGDERDGFGKRCPARHILTGPHKGLPVA